MSIFDDAGFELRSHFGPVVKWGLITLIVIIAVITAVATVIFSIAYKTRPPAMDEDRVPISEYGQATIQVFGCIEEGSACAEYEDAKDYLQASPGITYTPTGKSGPGEANGDGTRTVKFTSKSPRSDYVAFAKAVTADGALTSAGVSATDLAETGSDTVAFTYTDPDTNSEKRGTFTFTTAQSQKVLESVTSDTGGSS